MFSKKSLDLFIPKFCPTCKHKRTSDEGYVICLNKKFDATATTIFMECSLYKKDKKTIREWKRQVRNG